MSLGPQTAGRILGANRAEREHCAGQRIDGRTVSEKDVVAIIWLLPFHRARTVWKTTPLAIALCRWNVCSQPLRSNGPTVWLVLASTVTPASECHGTHDHILHVDSERCGTAASLGTCECTKVGDTHRPSDSVIQHGLHRERRAQYLLYR
jgi:hypothetical protein